MSTSTTKKATTSSGKEELDALFNRLRFLEEYVDYLTHLVRSSTIKQVEGRREYVEKAGL